MCKTEAVLFTRAKPARRRRMIRETNIQIGTNQIKFNEEATRWLGIWLDAGLTFKYHQSYRMGRAKTAEARLKGITNSFGLAPGLVRRIQIAAVQATALYGAELWWKDQKTYLTDTQRMINRQARSITGMFRSTPEGPLVHEAGLTPAKTLLDNCQRRYACRLLGLPEGHPTKSILPASLVSGDGSAQPGEQPEGDIDWAQGRGPKWLGHHLARQIGLSGSIDPAEGVEPIIETRPKCFSGTVYLEPTPIATRTAKDTPHAGLVLWSDGSRLENGATGAAVAWKRGDAWSTLKITLGNNKEIFDAELWGVSDALAVALRVAREQEPITVFLDSQAAIKKIEYLIGDGGQAITLLIHRRAIKLQRNGNPVTIRWVPGHCGIEGNEIADRAAKDAANGKGRRTAQWSSLAHVRRAITELASADSAKWLKVKMQNLRASGTQYMPFKNRGINKTLAKAPKLLAARYLQLKTGHASVGKYLKRINLVNTDTCWWCSTAAQDPYHLWAVCRKWRSERRVMKRALKAIGVAWPIPPTRKAIAELMSNERGTEVLLGFLQQTEVGAREGAAEKIREWGARRDRDGED